MNYPYAIQQFWFKGEKILLAIPDEKAVKDKYELQLLHDENTEFPYWTRLWPSSIALCEFISNNISLLKGKNVVEIAAGLGLPSVYSSQFARYVTCSDYAKDALDFIKHSFELNQVKNFETCSFNWNHDILPGKTDILLLSDINYAPEAFSKLIKLIIHSIENNISILLSTPQRLMAKPFIEQLLPFCVDKTTIPVKTSNNTVEIFIMRLEKQG